MHSSAQRAPGPVDSDSAEHVRAHCALAAPAPAALGERRTGLDAPPAPSRTLTASVPVRAIASAAAGEMPA